MPPYNIPVSSSIKEGGRAPILLEKREIAVDDDLPGEQLLERSVRELRKELPRQYLRDYL